jgi:magnesium-transporting ATPase (P-type)
MAQENWHQLTGEEVLKALDSDPSFGLTQEAAEARLEEYGPNSLPRESGPGPLKRFLAQFHNILIYILLIAAAVTAFLQHWIDSGVILAVVVINAVVGFIQEGKANQALEAIRKMLSLEAQTLRHGRKEKIPAENLVPGDIVFLQSGDKVPADIRLLECKELQIQEAILTGESEAVGKSPAPVEGESDLGDRFSMAYSGTMVIQGRGYGIVVATGQQSQIGQISSMVSQVQQLTTPLLRQITRFGWWLSGIILGASALVFVFGFFLRDYTFDELFLATVSIAVAAIPEGLPPIMTITLAIGVRRMAQRNAIIRKLPAVETLGSVTVICSDKTGTLTRNEMTVRTVVTTDSDITVNGTGYAPEGTFEKEGRPLTPTEDPILQQLLEAALLCNDSRLHQNDEAQWHVNGNPTEGALITLALKAGLQRDELDRKLPRTDHIPFESEHKYMGTLHQKGDVIYVKGAPERLLEMCATQETAQGEAEIDQNFWKNKLQEIAADGQRLLALARKPARGRSQLTHDDVRHGLVMLGLVGILDPPREEAIQAVKTCQAAGIKVKMITGDYAPTACSIGKQMNIGDGRNAITGRQIESSDEDNLLGLVQANDVFARTSPEHKLRLVEALQKKNQIVAMTGDGVNDAPALKRADVGIAMGIKGSEASKEAAEMVLADDNFASIEHAVEEGRTVYANLRKTLLFLLPTNGGQAGIIVLAIFMGMVLPITPVQILWINMVSVVTLALALAFEPPERGFMQTPPRDPSEAILTGYFIFRILYVSVLLLLLALGAFLYIQANGTLDLARTTAVNVLVMATIFYLFSSRYILQNVISFEGFFGNSKVWIAIGILLLLQAAFTYAPPMQLLFGTASLPPATLLLVLAAGIITLLLVEFEKFCTRQWKARNQ